MMFSSQQISVSNRNSFKRTSKLNDVAARVEAETDRLVFVRCCDL